MIKQKITVAILMAMMTVPLFGEIDDIKVGGYILGGYNALRQKNVANHTDQFDYAANLEIEFNVAKNLNGAVAFQGSPGGSLLGFNGPNPIFEMNLTYLMPESGRVFTFGSFDAPFGRQADYLSDNANTFSNSTILNPLLYSALGGQMSGPGVLGIMAGHTTKVGDFKFALTNGSGGSSSNPDGSHGTVIAYNTEPINDTISLGVSYMNTNDANSETGYNADFDASIVDVHFSKNKFDIKAYIAELHYEDQHSSTNDRVDSAMFEVKYQINKKNFVVARVNTWNPEDNTGDRSAVRDAEGAISEGLPNPGISTVQNLIDPVVDQDITRLQLGYGYLIEENVMLKAELFQDDYAKLTNGENTDTIGALAYINVRF
jgi:hypothetical protein